MKVLAGVVLGDSEARRRFAQGVRGVLARMYRRYFYVVGRFTYAVKRIPAHTHSKRIVRIASMAGEDNTRVSQWRESAAQYFYASAAIHHRRVFLNQIQNQTPVTTKSDGSENAVFYYRVALELAASPVGIHYNLGRMLLSQNKVAEAYFHFEEVICLIGSEKEQGEGHLKANAYWSQAEAFHVRGLRIAAIERFERANYHLDRFGAGQRLYADQLRQSGNLEEAANCFDFITSYAHRPMAEFIPNSNESEWIALIDQHGIFALDFGVVESTQLRTFFYSGLKIGTDDDQAVNLNGAELIQAYFDAPKAWKVSLPTSALEISDICQILSDVKKNEPAETRS